MTKNAGVWIDTKNAIIIAVIENKPTTIKTIESPVETRIRIQGETKKFGRFGNQYLTLEKKQRNKREEQISTFFKTIIKELNFYDEFVVFGPSKMKNLFEKEVFLNPKLVSKFKGIHTSDKLTKNQKVAWVKDYFKANA
jgi:stalled ribosome rescue protein Dom34